MYQPDRASRRHSAQILLQSNDQLHHRLPRIFSVHVPSRAVNDPSPHETALDEESLDRQQKPLMHNNHTFPPLSPSSRRAKHLSLPTYAHTMHAFTLNQLNDMANTGSHRRAASSPAVHIHQETQQRASTITSNHQPKTLPIPIPTTSASQMKHLTLDEAPYGPTNTPEFGSLALPRQAVLPPTSQDLVARGKELEERFEVMMSSGVGLQMQEGMSPQARDSANAAHRGVGVGSL